MGELSKLPNIGRALEEQLCGVGINSAEELKKTGSRAAWLKIFETDDSACFNRLLSLEGAVRGIKKSLLSDETRAELKAFYHENKRR